ncbi:uncharacterized protein LOC144559156 [Carex rostrata]
MNENFAWNPCSDFVTFLHEKYAKNETVPEEKPARRRGRPRNVRDVPPAKKLYEEPGASSEEEVDPVSGSDNEARYGHEDDDGAYQPLVNTIRSAVKLRGMRVQH